MNEPQTQNLTGWLRGKPKEHGWYNTRPVELADADNGGRTVRRHWDGIYWSRPVVVGETSDMQTALARRGHSAYLPDEIEYQGLTEPAIPTRRKLTT